MTDYHFDHTRNGMDKTIRLDTLNDEIKKIEQAQKQAEDELGDPYAYLNAFDSEQFEETFRQPLDGRQKGKKPSSPQPNRRFLVIYIGIGVLLCILFFLLFSGILRKKDSVSTEPFSAVLCSLTQEDEILVRDMTEGRELHLSFTEDTAYIDADGKDTTIDYFRAGMPVQITVNPEEETVTLLSAQGNFWTRENVTGYTFDTGSHSAQSETESLSVADHVYVFQAEEELQLADLADVDILTLWGSDKSIWAVEVMQGHGYLSVENTNDIKDGEIAVDDEEPVALDTIDRLPLSSGSHQLTLSGSNIETRKDTIIIEDQQEYLYDVSKAQEKMGVLFVNANVTDYKLYINGTAYTPGEPIVLPVGEYEVVMIKSGYKTFSETISLQEDTYTVNATLQTENGYVSITTDPVGAEISINGTVYGTSSINAALPYGTYTAQVRADGYMPKQVSFTISESPVTLSVVLEKE